jgi:hypothetical protein
MKADGLLSVANGSVRFSAMGDPVTLSEAIDVVSGEMPEFFEGGNGKAPHGRGKEPACEVSQMEIYLRQLANIR